jgi:hypothetical protein
MMAKRTKRAKKSDDKPITAQPIGAGFFTRTGRSVKANLQEDSRGRTIESPGVSGGDGCYRRVPRFFNG